jgi:hypothetical protein
LVQRSLSISLLPRTCCLVPAPLAATPRWVKERDFSGREQVGRKRRQERCRVIQGCHHGAGASCSGPSPCAIHRSAWREILRNSFAGSCVDRPPRGVRMASKTLHASWRRSTSCGVGWICRETQDPPIAVTLAALLCTPLPQACPKTYTRRGPPGSERRRRPCYRRIVPAGLETPYPSARSVSLVL